MGWFDRKNPDLDDVDPQPQATSRPAAVNHAAKNAAAAKPAANSSASKPAAKSAAAKPAAKSMSASEFGIQKAIELMRNLPPDNIPLVVSVVRATLESANVSVKAIISDAEIKQAKIENRIGTLEGEIKDYEEEIAARRDEIKRLKADFKETSDVRDKLELSMKPDTSGPISKSASAPAKADPAKSDPGLISPAASVTKGASPLLSPSKTGTLPGTK